MKLIKHIIFTDIDDNKKLMINSLNGLMDQVDYSIFETITNWKASANIIPNTEWEKSLYDHLQARGYLVNSHDEEIAKKEQILEALRKRNTNRKANKGHITFIMTYDCNFRCPYCFEEMVSEHDEEQATHAKKAVLTPTLIDAALAFAGEDLRSIALFGGEPLLPKTRPALEYLLSRVPDKVYSIATNGYYLEEFFDLLSKINLSQVKVTLDGEEETHNSRRYLANKEPTYQKVMAGIKKYLENQIPVCIRMNVDASNIATGKRLKMKLLKEFSAFENLLSFEMSPIIGATINERAKIFLDLYHSDIENSQEERERRNRLFGTGTPFLNAITIKKRPEPVYTLCAAHENGFSFDPHGKIFPCLVAVGNDELAIGTYYPAVKFEENSLRDRNIDSIPQCRECKYSLLCGGGCALVLNDYRKLFRPECLTIKSQIHRLLPAFYQMEQRQGEDA